MESNTRKAQTFFITRKAQIQPKAQPKAQLVEDFSLFIFIFLLCALPPKVFCIFVSLLPPKSLLCRFCYILWAINSSLESTCNHPSIHHSWINIVLFLEFLPQIFNFSFYIVVLCYSFFYLYYPPPIWPVNFCLLIFAT